MTQMIIGYGSLLGCNVSITSSRTKVLHLHNNKTGCQTGSDLTCRLCSKAHETQAHVLAGCCALAQMKYLSRNNAALQILFFELLKGLELVDSVPPWYSPAQPKVLYENSRAKAYWDAESTEVRANRIDACIVDKESKRVMLLEISCPWTSNKEAKDTEKTLKYALLRHEIKMQMPGYKVKQHNIVIDVLGGCSMSVRESLRSLVGQGRSASVLCRMQKAVVSSTLNTARSFKIMSA